MFDVVEKTGVTVQPVVVHYRLRDGTKINDEDMANHFAYFDNKRLKNILIYNTFNCIV